MNLKTNLFAILAIFCVVLSACAVSAADNVADQSGDYYLDGSHDGHDGAIIPPDVNHNEEAMMNATGNGTGNATGHAAGENVTVATGNATNSTISNVMHATGNPILLLLGVCAVLGGGCALRRKK